MGMRAGSDREGFGPGEQLSGASGLSHLVVLPIRTEVLDMLNGLKAALANGTLSKARVDEAATRILTLKLQRHIMPLDTPQYYGLTQ